LNKLGYKLLEDGVFGPLTKVAVKQFQTDQLLKVDGVVGDCTRNALRTNPTARIQERLDFLGFSLVVDGQFGHKTEAAVVEFQKQQHLVVDGHVGCQTKAALITADVRKIQETLNALGSKIHVDGLLGPETHDATKAFQKANGLVDDGIVGPKTRAVFKAKLGK